MNLDRRTFFKGAALLSGTAAAAGACWLRPEGPDG